MCTFELFNETPLLPFLSWIAFHYSSLHNVCFFCTPIHTYASHISLVFKYHILKSLKFSTFAGVHSTYGPNVPFLRARNFQLAHVVHHRKYHMVGMLGNATRTAVG